MKIVALSDLHGSLPKIVPECDVVVIAGDILPLNIQRKIDESICWLCNDFKDWANNLECQKVIFIAGNHDFVFERFLENKFMNSAETEEMIFEKNNNKIVYLCDSKYVWQDKTFYGFPWCPNLEKWAFYKNETEMEKAVQLIPNKLDVLITHCPPQSTLQATVLQQGWNYMTDFGCQELTTGLISKDINWCICGHIHSGKHTPDTVFGTNVVNVSIKDEDYKISYNLFEFEI